MQESNQSDLESKENMEIQDNITKIKTRQLGRLMQQLKVINTPQIILDAVEKYWNFFYLDILEETKQGKSGNYDKSNKQA
jgi:hypothetical protein